MTTPCLEVAMIFMILNIIAVLLNTFHCNHSIYALLIL